MLPGSKHGPSRCSAAVHSCHVLWLTGCLLKQSLVTPSLWSHSLWSHSLLWLHTLISHTPAHACMAAVLLFRGSASSGVACQLMPKMSSQMNTLPQSASAKACDWEIVDRGTVSICQGLGYVWQVRQLRGFAIVTNLGASGCPSSEVSTRHLAFPDSWCCRGMRPGPLHDLLLTSAVTVSAQPSSLPSPCHPSNRPRD